MYYFGEEKDKAEDQTLNLPIKVKKEPGQTAPAGTADVPAKAPGFEAIAGMDLAAMLVRDIGIEVKDDYENVDTIKKKNIIEKELAEELKRLNGMRNAIVHKYGDLNIDLILENLESIKEILHRFIEQIEGELE